MISTSRSTIQVQPEPEINPVPQAVQNHRDQQEEDEEEEELGIVRRAKESDFTAISMQQQASTDSSNPDSSLEDYL